MNPSRTITFAAGIAIVAVLATTPVFSATVTYVGEDPDWGADFTSVGGSVGDLDTDGTIGSDGYYFPVTSNPGAGAGGVSTLSSLPSYVTAFTPNGATIANAGGGYPSFVTPDGVTRRAGTWNPATATTATMFTFDFTGTIPTTVGLTLFVDALDGAGWSGTQYTVDVAGSNAVANTTPNSTYSGGGAANPASPAVNADMLHFTISGITAGDTVTVTGNKVANANLATLQGFALESSGAAPPPGPVVVADLGGDWVGPGALPTNWEYLASNAANGGVEVALTPNMSIGNEPGGDAIGFGSAAGDPDFNLAAVLGDNANGNDYEIFADGQGNGGVVGTDMLVHPAGDPDQAYVIMRYTLTAADLLNGSDAEIEGSFRNLIGGGNSVTGIIYHNGDLIFSANGNDAGGTDGNTGQLSQADGTFDLMRTVAAGDTISFIVFRNGDRGADETAIRATIALSGASNAIPAPAALPAGLAMIGVLAARRRRR